MRKSVLSLVLLALLAIGTLPSIATACPNCKESISNTSEEASTTDVTANVSSGFNTSIYVMLGAFVGVLGMVSYTLYQGVRSTK